MRALALIVLGAVGCGRSEVPFEVATASDSGVVRVDAGNRDAGVSDCMLPAFCADACIGVPGVVSVACGVNRVCCRVGAP